MGTMYNMLHGQNPQSGILLYILGIDQEKGAWRSGRFRDIYLSEDGSEIVLYTRNGGGNREHYADDCEPGIDCTCTGCTAEYHLPSHPNYLRDWDDDFDSTYAYFAFSIPKEFKEAAGLLVTGEKPETIYEKFSKTLAEMKTMSAEQLREDKRFRPLVSMVDQIGKSAK